jgi:hypothetical protein
MRNNKCLRCGKVFAIDAYQCPHCNSRSRIPIGKLEASRPRLCGGKRDKFASHHKDKGDDIPCTAEGMAERALGVVTNPTPGNVHKTVGDISQAITGTRITLW